MTTTNVDLSPVHDDVVRIYLAQGRAEEAWTESRMLFLDEHAPRGYHDVRARIISVHAHPSKFHVAALGMTGVVSVATRSGISFEQIEGPGTGAGKFGYAKRIRFIGDVLFACGDMRQVYRRGSELWERFDQGLREEDARQVGCSLNDLAGASDASIYAVGDRGRIFHYHSSHWHECPAVTNASLERVLVDEKGNVWACGAKGTLLCGQEDTWDVVNFDPSGNETFWGMARYDATTYVCSSRGVYRYRSPVLELVEPADAVGRPFRLAADDLFLWAMGPQRLVRFDGTKWSDVSLE
jgi:hypothetical protein